MQKDKLKKEVKQFCEETTCHGMFQIVKPNQYIWFRVFMVLFLLAAIGWSINGAIEAITKYYSYPYEIKSGVKTVTRKPFPSVSICNLKPVYQEVFLEQMVTGHYDNMILQECNMTSADLKLIETNNRYDGTVTLAYENSPPEVIEEVAYAFQDLIMHCKFGDNVCTEDNFTRFLHPEYGYCYTYNSINQNIQENIGVESGLSLILYADTFHIDYNNFDPNLMYSFNYAEGKSNSAVGFVIVTHPAGSMPNPKENAINVMPGYSTSIAIRPTSITRLKAPYESNCTDSGNIYNTTHKYNKNTCLSFCKQDYILKECGCKSPELPSRHSNSTFCGTVSSIENCTLEKFTEQLKCEMNAQKHFNADKCNCKLPCSEMIYHSQISMSYWPRDSLQATFLDKYVYTQNETQAYCAFTQHPLRYMLENGFVHKNFARVNVFHDSTVESFSTEEPSYSTWSAISSTGGSFGFWCGVSVLTMFDALAFVSKLLYIVIFKGKQQKTTVTVLNDKSNIEMEKYKREDNKDSFF